MENITREKEGKVRNEQIAKALLKWYAKNARHYPFRNVRDPYRMLVCAMLLNRTTVDQVSAVYHEFFDKFPSVRDLADASEEGVFKVVKPLGMRKRANALISAAKFVVNEWGGEIPSDLESLMKIKGVGRYVGSCVLAFAFGKNVPMVDSNVERVLCRIKGIENPSGAEKKDIWEYYKKLAPKSHLREFHCALIDLSHAHCRPRLPSCPSCDLSSLCQTSSQWVAAKEDASTK